MESLTDGMDIPDFRTREDCVHPVPSTYSNTRRFRASTICCYSFIHSTADVDGNGQIGMAEAIYASNKIGMMLRAPCKTRSMRMLSAPTV
jgi:hypothetical protein